MKKNFENHLLSSTSTSGSLLLGVGCNVIQNPESRDAGTFVVKRLRDIRVVLILDQIVSHTRNVDSMWAGGLLENGGDDWSVTQDGKFRVGWVGNTSNSWTSMNSDADLSNIGHLVVQVQSLGDSDKSQAELDHASGDSFSVLAIMTDPRDEAVRVTDIVNFSNIVKLAENLIEGGVDFVDKVEKLIWSRFGQQSRCVRDIGSQERQVVVRLGCYSLAGL
jgi:hypothetical protein